MNSLSRDFRDMAERHGLAFRGTNGRGHQVWHGWGCDFTFPSSPSKPSGLRNAEARIKRQRRSYMAQHGNESHRRNR